MSKEETLWKRHWSELYGGNKAEDLTWSEALKQAYLTLLSLPVGSDALCWAVEQNHLPMVVRLANRNPQVVTNPAPKAKVPLYYAAQGGSLYVHVHMSCSSLYALLCTANLSQSTNTRPESGFQLTDSFSYLACAPPISNKMPLLGQFPYLACPFLLLLTNPGRCSPISRFSSSPSGMNATS